MDRTDSELLGAVKRDPDAFRIFYERHVSWIFFWFRRQTNNVEDAMDLTAETFAQALRATPRFRRSRADKDGSARGWLFGIARNLLLVYLRDRRTADWARRRLGIPRWDYALEELERVEDEADCAALAPQLGAALNRLSPPNRRALELRVLDDRPPRSQLNLGAPRWPHGVGSFVLSRRSSPTSKQKNRERSTDEATA
jgi:RNA polymerase sigma factor (sigma-70 family)